MASQRAAQFTALLSDDPSNTFEATMSRIVPLASNTNTSTHNWDIDRAVAACEWQRPADVEKVKSFLRIACKTVFPSQVNSVLETGTTLQTMLLFTAARANNAPIVEFLIKEGKADPNATAPELRHNTAMHIACFHLHVNVVKVLKDSGASTFLLNDDNETALNSFGKVDASKHQALNAVLAILFGKTAMPDPTEDELNQVLADIQDPTNLQAVTEFMAKFPLYASRLITTVGPDGEEIETTLLYSASRCNNLPAVNALLNQNPTL